MKTTLTSLLGIFSMIGLMATGAQALTFDLNCVISGGSCTQSLNSYGSLTLTDGVVNPNSVDLNLTLSNLPTTAKILSFDLNYDFTNYVAGDTFKFIYGTNTKIADVTLDGEGAGSIKVFDVEVPKSGNLGNTATSPLNGYLALYVGNTNTLRNLDASYFNLGNSAGLYAGVHVNNDGNGTGNSIWIGSKDGVKIPEPSTLLLLGSGLVGLGLFGRQRKG